MPLAEILTLQVGTAISKALVRLWLRDNNLAQDISGGVLDILQQRIEGSFDRQRARRQFEAIGERVAESLLQIFETEGESLDDSGRSAVAFAVADTLNNPSINTTLLAELDLDPARLSSRLLELAAQAAKGFSEVENALFQRVISEACQDIVDIASNLPAFHERTSAELLKRENQLLSVADLILDEVRRIRTVNQDVELKSDANRFEADYRRAVKRHLDELRLFGVTLESDVNRRQNLSVAYISLTVENKAMHIADERSPNNEIDADDQAGDVDNEYHRQLIAVEEALAQSRYILIGGDAGSGKTTLLQWIAVRSAGRDFPDTLSDWNSIVPFFISLRQCYSDLPAPEDFPSLVAKSIAGTMPLNWVHNKLRSGYAVVLVDGVDEVPENIRENARNWLIDLTSSFPDSRFIISSRPYALDNAWLNLEKFTYVELQPMDLPDIDVFIDRWHEAVRANLKDSEDANKLVELASNLKKIVRERRAIRNLATTPLLCAMLCALYRDRLQQLPSDRIELYEAGCQMLLYRRDFERQVPLTDYPQLTYRQKKALLQDLAYWLLVNNWTMTTEAKAEERIKAHLVKMDLKGGEITAAKVLKALLQRSGMLRMPVVGQVDFVHRTFQEFLAAQTVLDEGNTGLLLMNAHNDQWYEVVILAVGLAGIKNREEIIKGLLERGDQEKERRSQLYILAIACLETAVELSEDIRRRLKSHLRQMIPPGSMREASALVSAGDLAVPYLKPGKGKIWRDGVRAAAAVRALASIGTDSALDALESYLPDRRQRVLIELLRAWDSFDRLEYSRRILANKFGSLLSITDAPFITSLEGIEVLDNLKMLKLDNCKHLFDIKPISGLKNLDHLEIRRCNSLRDFSPVGDLVNLKSLTLQHLYNLPNLAPISNLMNLLDIKIQSCVNIRDLAPLAGLQRLKTLAIVGCPNLSDLTPLQSLALVDLTISNLSEVKDLNVLAKLSPLRHLTISSLEKVTDLTPLINLTQLEVLIIGSCPSINDIQPLAVLKQLKQLFLSSIDGVSNFDPLIELKSETRLTISTRNKNVAIPPELIGRIRILPS